MTEHEVIAFKYASTKYASTIVEQRIRSARRLQSMEVARVLHRLIFAMLRSLGSIRLHSRVEPQSK